MRETDEEGKQAIRRQRERRDRKSDVKEEKENKEWVKHTFQKHTRELI